MLVSLRQEVILHATNPTPQKGEGQVFKVWTVESCVKTQGWNVAGRVLVQHEQSPGSNP